MAPPKFPNGFTLHDIGIAALKYPQLAPAPFNVPLGNLVGALQHQPSDNQNQQTAQIASQYLDALIAYQASAEPTLHDPSLPQYYFSTAVCLLNFLNMNPDVCKRVAAHPTLINDIIEKLLADDFVDNMKKVKRPGGPNFPPATFDDDFGSLLQFLSTILLYRAEMPHLTPRVTELVPKLKVWKVTYRNSRVRTIRNAAERLVDQIEGSPEMLGMIGMMRGMQEQSLACGVASCHVEGASNLTACGSCRVQRYCGKEHQKADWKHHKHICGKGLVEEEGASA